MDETFEPVRLIPKRAIYLDKTGSEGMNVISLSVRKIVSLWHRAPMIAILSLFIALVEIAGSPVNAQGRGNAGVMREIPSGRPAGFEPPMGGRADNLPSAADRGLATAMEASDGRLSRAQRARAKEFEKLQPELFETDRFGALAIRGEVLALGLTTADLKKLKDNGFRVIREVSNEGLDNAIYVVSRHGTASRKAIKRLRRLSPEGTFAHNHVYFESGALSSGAQALPARLNKLSAITVGLIDASVAAKLPAFDDISIMQRLFAADGGSPSGHGTAVASILAGNKSLSSKATRPVSLYVGSVYGRDGRGGTAELLSKALGWMSSQKIAVINVSLVGPPNAVIERIIGSLTNRGHIIVAPVGNDGASARPLYPAAYTGVVAVSAVDRTGKLIPEASQGTRVDFVALGIASAPDNNGKMTTVRGTSFAAPVVSRRLAEFLKSPDPAAAKAALIRLKSEAVRPKNISSKRKYGYGLIQ